MIKKYVTFLFCVMGLQPSFSEVYSSSTDMKRIFRLEKELTDLLWRYSEKLKYKLSRIEEYLKEVETTLSDKFEDDSSDDEYFERISGHPIHAYKLVKRFSVDWKKLEKDVVEEDWPELELKIRKKKLSTIIPKEEDLHGSAQALLRVHDVYELDVGNLSEGLLDDSFTAAKLTAKDCLFMGKHSFNSGDLARSLEWFEQAWVLAGKNTNNDTATSVSRNDVKNFIDYAAKEHDTRVLNGEKSQNLFPKPVHEIPPFEQRKKLRSEEIPTSEEQRFKALCRGEELRSSREVSRLKCFTTSDTHPYYLLHPVMAEEVHESPRIVLFHDVISEKEMDTVRSLGEPLLMRSQVQGQEAGASKVSNTRTSKTGWLQDSFHSIIEKISQRVSLITGLNSNTWKEDAELLQIANYINGGHYNPHHDYVIRGKDPDKMIYLNERESLYIGDRIATWMIYMNKVVSGGRTVFPRLGVGVKPVSGSAVFWYNLKRSGEADDSTLHGACPILLGSKWVSNKWIREGAQFLTRPCGLSKYE